MPVGFSAGEWVVLEQCLAEITVNGEHFPEILDRMPLMYKNMSGESWDALPLDTRIGMAAVALHYCGMHEPNGNGPVRKIHRAYIKLCQER